MESRTNHLTGDTVANARAEKISEPVILYLEKGCPQAHAIYRSLYGKTMKAKKINDAFVGAMVTLGRFEAIRLLRNNCGSAGALLGDALQKSVTAQDSVVYVMKYFSQLITFADNRRLVIVLYGYDQILVQLNASGSKLVEGGITLWNLVLEDGESVPLCFPGTPLLVSLLVKTALTRKLFVDQKGGTCREAEAFDADLAEKLLEFEERPAIIAEAIRALRKLGPDKDRWLISVLWGDRRLRALARKVEHELTGL